MNFYDLVNNFNDDIETLSQFSDKIRLMVPLSSYHDEARNALSSEESRDNFPTNDTEQKSDDYEDILTLASRSFNKATKYDVNGLIDLITFSWTPYFSRVKKEYLEKILFADHNDPHALYSDRYLMIVADCLAGMYTFNTARDYPKAIALYNKVEDMLGDENTYMKLIAQKRIKCCEMLDCTELNPPSTELLTKVKENAQTDNFSRVILGCYYITAPEIQQLENYKAYYAAGLKLLLNSVEENYRPGVTLLEYLSKKKMIEEFEKKNVKHFRKENNPPISENNWYE